MAAMAAQSGGNIISVMVIASPGGRWRLWRNNGGAANVAKSQSAKAKMA